MPALRRFPATIILLQFGCDKIMLLKSCSCTYAMCIYAYVVAAAMCALSMQESCNTSACCLCTASRAAFADFMNEIIYSMIRVMNNILHESCMQVYSCVHTHACVSYQ
jgi:hypothetical protein